jgi:DNA helicase II / ATP-dependent DNA helicase PcrA
MALSPKFEERYKNLNAQQKKAVDTIEGPLMVVAGPGSGKTEILSLRVANILAQTQVRPGNILCLTFTDYAAINMRKRLIPLLGVDAYRVAVHTFHDFCVDIIGRFPDFFYNGATFSAADELVQVEVLEDIFKEMTYEYSSRGGLCLFKRRTICNQ